MSEVKREAERRRVELLIVPTTDAIEALQQDTEEQRNLARDLLIAASKPFGDQYANLSRRVRQKKFA